MIYVEIRIKLPRHRVKEALDVWAATGAAWDEQNMHKVGAKAIGCWATQYGSKAGEITFLMAYPTLEARDDLQALIGADPEFSKWMTQVWREKYAADARIRVLKPAAFSALD
jgi:hypothetical protein